MGSQGEREPPAGAARVDLTGRTVIPALIDAHQHIGLTNVRDGTHSRDNYTRANLVEHLERAAYHGVAATMSLGLEADEALAFELRAAVVPNGARFLTSGRGIAATPLAGPQQEYRLGIPRGAQTEAEGRAAVAELHGHGVELVKIWVDDRGGTVPKLQPEVYRAIIDEAHARGMRVTSHLGSTSGLADAKDLLRAGVDGFAHTVRDRDIDAEYMELVRAHPDVWTVPNLPGSPVTLDDLPWLAETLPPFEIENLRAEAERLAAEGPSASFELQCRNLARNREAEMLIGMGTDSGVSVGWTTHTELRDMAGCVSARWRSSSPPRASTPTSSGSTTSAPWLPASAPRSWCSMRTRWRTSAHAPDRGRLSGGGAGGPRRAQGPLHGRRALRQAVAHAGASWRHPANRLDGVHFCTVDCPISSNIGRVRRNNRNASSRGNEREFIRCTK